MVSNAIIIISVIIIGSVFAAGGELAFGEVYKYSGAFPVPDNLEKSAERCFVEHTDSQTLIFSCKYIFTAENIEEWFEDRNTKSENVLICPHGYDQETKECLDEVIISEAILPVIVDAQGNPVSEYVIKMQAKELEKYKVAHELCLAEPPTDNDGKNYCILVADATVCYRGEDEARGITSGSFITSVGEILSSDEYPVASQMDDALSALYRATLECDYQVNILEKQQLGPYTLNRGIFEDSIQKSSRDMMHYDENDWPTVPNHKASQFSAHDFEKEKQKAFDTMCENPQFELKSQLVLGCDVEREYQVSKDGSCREGLVLNEDKDACIYATVTPRTDGGIQYGHYLTDAKDRWTISDKEQLDKIQHLQRQEFDKSLE